MRQLIDTKYLSLETSLISLVFLFELLISQQHKKEDALFVAHRLAQLRSHV